MRFNLSNRKGQSAIEYLMTYGWMLLVVAIVGGAVITTVQDNQNACEKQINDFEATQNAFGVSDFAVTSSALNIEFRNNNQEDVTINTVTISNSTGTVATLSPGATVGFGDTTTVSASEVTSSDDCNTYDVTVEYDKDGLDSELTGSLQDRMTA